MTQNLIGISGKIGSGKDSVGNILLYLAAKKYNFPGLLNKDTKFTTSQIINHPYDNGTHTKWHIKKFAFKLKLITSILTGCPINELENQQFKNSYLSDDWNYSGSDKKGIFTYHSEYSQEKIKQYTYREFLQRLGTEAIRNQIHPNTWVNALFADYKINNPKEGKTYSTLDMPNWIITDVRFPNEAKAIKDRGGLVIKVDRPNYCPTCKIDKTINQGGLCTRTDCPSIKLVHESETALDAWEFDYIIHNTSTSDALIHKVEIMVDLFQSLGNINL